jgi:hypothetical protein
LRVFTVVLPVPYAAEFPQVAGRIIFEGWMSIEELQG